MAQALCEWQPQALLMLTLLQAGSREEYLFALCSPEDCDASWQLRLLRWPQAVRREGKTAQTLPKVWAGKATPAIAPCVPVLHDTTLPQICIKAFRELLC